MPFIFVCGKKEVADNTVTVRKLGSDKQETIKREELIKRINFLFVKRYQLMMQKISS